MPKGQFPRSPEHVARWKASMAAYWERGPSVETRVRQSLARRGHKHSAETRAKISRAQKGIAKSESHRRRTGEATRRRASDPAYREKMSRALSYKTWEQYGYAMKHDWVNTHFVDPGACEDCGVQGRRLEWASIGHIYTQNRHDWQRLCVPCHRRLDRKRC